MTHSTTLSLLHCTHLNTCRRPVRFFLTIFLLACRTNVERGRLVNRGRVVSRQSRTHG